MGKKNDEIEKKLLELENAVIKEDEEQKKNELAREAPASRVIYSGSTGAESTSVKQDLYYFAGLGLIICGLLMLFQQVRVGSGLMAALGLGGGGGFGIFLVPLIVGVGWLIYDSKSRWGWILTAVSCGIMVFAILTSVVMWLPNMSLLSFIFLLAPFAVGGGLLLKGMGGPKGLEDKLKNSNK